ncbi:MAG TPA: RHO alpha subunit C-terminal catalytic domain-containing protein, partial [Chloroflexota bacterium]|nr:RHO alpha subunit C-terminal catalytic domain-containing protein [Chloroflexota bacterium]
RTAHVEVTGPPMRWTVDANWKLGAANFSGDGHHLPTTHGYGVALGLDASRGRRIGYVLHTDAGHCAQMRYCPPGTIDTPPYLGLPEEMWPEIQSRLSPDQLDVMNSHLSYSGNLFPNLSFLCVSTVSFLNTEWQQDGAEQRPVVSFLTIRQWQPKGPNQMEVWSWLLADRDAPSWWKEASRSCYARAFGLAGMHEQDDVENWANINQGLASPAARNLALNYQMCLDATPSPDWRGPGTAYLYPSFSEINERAFYQAWAARMECS